MKTKPIIYTPNWNNKHSVTIISSALYILDNFYPFLLKITRFYFSLDSKHTVSTCTDISEHVNGSDAFYSVTVLPEIFHLLQRRGITAHINDLLRCHLYDRLKAELITSLSWRIDNNHIGFVGSFVLFGRTSSAFPTKNSTRYPGRCASRLSRVLDGRRDNLDTSGGFPGEGSRSIRSRRSHTVSPPFKSTGIQCCSVETFCLNRVYLIER